MDRTYGIFPYDTIILRVETTSFMPILSIPSRDLSYSTCRVCQTLVNMFVLGTIATKTNKSQKKLLT